MARRSGGKSNGGGRRRQTREILEAIPKDVSLARLMLGRINVNEELHKLKAGEEERHYTDLHRKALTDPPARNPFGASLASRSAPKLSRSTSMPVSFKAPPAADDSSSSSSVAGQRGGRFEDVTLCMQDPTSLPNMYGLRTDALDVEIAQRQEELQDYQASAKRRLAALACEPPGRGQVFHWDRPPRVFGLSEAQAQLFPRSLSRTKECGGGRDKRYCRPHDVVYIHREAVARSKDLPHRL